MPRLDIFFADQEAEMADYKKILKTSENVSVNMKNFSIFPWNLDTFYIVFIYLCFNCQGQWH